MSRSEKERTVLVFDVTTWKLSKRNLRESRCKRVKSDDNFANLKISDRMRTKMTPALSVEVS